METNNIVQKFREETDKIKQVAQMQLNAKIISGREYRKILFLLMEKLEEKKDDIEKLNIPEINISNFADIKLFNLTEALFCTG